jgi:hypothetical protein
VLLRAVPGPDDGFKLVAVTRSKRDLDSLPHQARLAYQRADWKQSFGGSKAIPTRRARRTGLCQDPKFTDFGRRTAQFDPILVMGNRVPHYLTIDPSDLMQWYDML